MKRVVASLLAALCFNALAAPPAASLITPSPLGIVIAVKSYLKDQKKVYYIRVESQARDFEQAKKQAFRLASEQVAGTVVLSESELRNSKLTRDEIITYSSGLIDEYKIVDRHDAPGSVKLTMDVWIVESVMAQRLLAKSATEKGVNGDILGTRVGSILEERQRGDRVFKAIIQDIPRRSFLVKTGTPNIQMDAQRNTWAIINWDVSWDSRFLAAFFEAAKETGRERCAWRCPPTPVYFIQGFEFDDNQKHMMIAQYIESMRLVIMFEVVDIQNQVVARTCDSLSDGRLGSSSLGPLARLDPGIIFLSSNSINRQTQINFGSNPDLISRIDQIRANIVPGASCRPL